MKRKYSLKGRACFKTVYREGKRIRQKGFTCFAVRHCSQRNKNFCRKKERSVKVGIVVPKYFGKAYERNRAKRIFRELFRKCCVADFRDYCLIIRLYNGFMDMSEKDIKMELESCLLKLNRLQK